MSPPVPFYPQLGDRVEVLTLGGRTAWIDATIVRVPVGDETAYEVQVGEGQAPLRRSIFEMRQVRQYARAELRVSHLEKRHATRHTRFTKRVALCDELLRTMVDAFDPETPHRMARALEDLTDGYDQGDDFSELLKTFDVDSDPGIVVVRDMPFASVCEHHVLPFAGKASVAYLPARKIVGLSKIPRLVRAVSRRLQVQERIGQQVADALQGSVEGCRGVLVVLRGQHTCMALRGVQSQGEMVTSAARGVFLDDAAARAEALHLLGV